MLAAEAQYRVRRTLEDNGRAAALRRLLDELRHRVHDEHSIANAIAVLEAASHEGLSAGSSEVRATIIEFSWTVTSITQQGDIMSASGL